MNESQTDFPGSRCTMGVAGLDEILLGGLPRDRLYLIHGDPGVGKTTLALQFLLEGIRRGETALYITLSETQEELHLVAQSHGWDLGKISLFELSAIEQQIRGQAETTFFHPSEVELNRTTKMLLDEVERLKPSRLVFDSLSEMRMLTDTPLRYRKQILNFKRFFAGRKCTVLLLDDRPSGTADFHVESIAHGVISLHRASPDYGIARRQLNVVKIRGSHFQEGNHDFVLRKGGMVVFPRLVASEHHAGTEPENFSCGISELDLLLGGGVGRGTSNMFMGPPGTGKSTLAIKIALEAAQRREKVLFFMFDESTSTLLHRAKQLGMDLTPHIEEGTIILAQIDPAEISPGELANRVQGAVIENQVRFVVIDSINGYLNAMPGERYLDLQLHELLAFLNHQGVVTIMVLAQQGFIGAMDSRVDLTYLADTVVMLRFFESRGSVRQAISVIKKRSGNHERTIREIRIGAEGIELGPPLTNLHGVLTGIPGLASAEAEAVTRNE